MIWYNLIPFGCFTNKKKVNATHNFPFVKGNVNPCVVCTLYNAIWYWDETLLFPCSTIHSSASYLPDQVHVLSTMDMFTWVVHCTTLPLLQHLTVHFFAHLYGSVCACAYAWALVLVCYAYARPFRQLKVKYYSLFGKVLNYIYSFVYANKAIRKVSMLDNISGINSLSLPSPPNYQPPAKNTIK